MLTFVFSNPRHHLDMMVPVASELVGRGVACRFVSLAELRGLETPELAARLPGVPMKRAVPRIRRTASAGAGVGTSGRGARVRTIVRAASWRLALRPRLSWLLRGSRAVVVPNDTAFPYGELADHLRETRVPFALLQEGIRFPLPVEQQDGRRYGASGAAVICVWGEGSANHFRSLGVPTSTLRVTGNPRFDAVAPAAWRDRGHELAAKLGLSRAPLLYLSNTIDDQGFCTTAAKMELFARFLECSAPVLRASERSLVVKLHAREDAAAFRRVASQYPTVHVVGDESLFAVLAMGHAAVVLASTVGLEAIAFGLPLGVLELPRHGHVFDYVACGVAEPLRLDDLASGIGRLLAAGTRAGATDYLEHHMAHRGRAATNIADCIVGLTGAA